MYVGKFKEVMVKAAYLINYAQRKNDQAALDYYNALWKITDYCIKTQDKENFPQYAARVVLEWENIKENNY
jgi:hypothetical protein